MYLVICEFPSLGCSNLCLIGEKIGPPNESVDVDAGKRAMVPDSSKNTEIGAQEQKVSPSFCGDAELSASTALKQWSGIEFNNKTDTRSCARAHLQPFRSEQ
jgi:hypothetical protein